MKNNITELVFILDKSGSMSGMEKDTIGGFNSMIRKQKEQDGEVYVTTVLFSNTSETVHDRLRLGDIPEMTGKDYFVGGCTALLDAVGDTVTHIETIHKYARPEDVPEHTVFVITTDGMENASRKYSQPVIKKMIGEKQQQGWEFIFMAANIDAAAAADAYGINRDNAVDYVCDEAGTQLNYCVVSEAVRKVRSGAKLTREWKKDIEADYQERSGKS